MSELDDLAAQAREAGPGTNPRPAPMMPCCGAPVPTAVAPPATRIDLTARAGAYVFGICAGLGFITAGFGLWVLLMLLTFVGCSTVGILAR